MIVQWVWGVFVLVLVVVLVLVLEFGQREYGALEFWSNGVSVLRKSSVAPSGRIH
jgi:hypothetical protein